MSMINNKSYISTKSMVLGELELTFRRYHTHPSSSQQDMRISTSHHSFKQLLILSLTMPGWFDQFGFYTASFQVLNIVGQNATSSMANIHNVSPTFATFFFFFFFTGCWEQTCVFYQAKFIKYQYKFFFSLANFFFSLRRHTIFLVTGQQTFSHSTKTNYFFHVCG